MKQRITFLVIVTIIVLLCMVLNFTFSAFTTETELNIATVKIGELSYDVKELSSEKTKFEISPNETKNYLISISSLNTIPTKYELFYDEYTNNSYNKLNNNGVLEVTLSADSLANISDIIEAKEQKTISLTVKNPTNNVVYFRFNINAGYSQNPLELISKIKTPIKENKLITTILVNGEVSSNLPETNDYNVQTTCDNNFKLQVVWEDNKYTLKHNPLEQDTTCKITFNDKVTLLNYIKEKNNLKATEDGTTYYFSGNPNNNYVLYDNMCYRIVKITNEDMLLTLHNQTNTCETEDSLIETEYQNKETILKSFNNKEHIMLSSNDIEMTKEEDSSFLFTEKGYWTSTIVNELSTIAVINNELVEKENTENLSIRPSIHVSDRYFTGNGELTNPYVIK